MHTSWHLDLLHLRTSTGEELCRVIAIALHACSACTTSRAPTTPVSGHAAVTCGRRYMGYPGSPLQEMLREHVPLELPILQVSAAMRRRLDSASCQGLCSRFDVP